jgi:N-acetyl sugar amidotransferase
MIYCKRCVLPSTKPGLFIDSDGICSACRSVEKKWEINWDERAASLNQICNEIRGKNKDGYDCIVPVSGGKDSCYQVYMMSQVYKLKILAVNISAHVQTTEGIENLNNLVTNYNVDLIKIYVRPSTHKKIRKQAFFDVGNPNFAEHRVVFAAVAKTALFYNAPLVVWGEDIGVEFGGNVSNSSLNKGSADDLINNDLFRETSFESLIGDRISDGELFFYDNPNIEDVKRLGVKSIYLGYFHWWDGIKNYHLAHNLGFTGRREGPLPGNYLNYDNIDEKLCEVHSWMKFIKLGFWRPHDHTSYKIYNGYMTREEAVKHINKVQYEKPAYLDEFLEFHQINKRDFNSKIEELRNKNIWHKINGEWRLKYELK